MKRLTDQEIEKLNQLIKEGNSYIEVSKKFNCSKATIFKYLKEENKIRKNKFNDSSEVKKRRKSLNVINWKKEKKKQLVEYKGGNCEKCGYNRCLSALEFHHIDPKKKDFSVSTHNYSFERMRKEADKCILLCSNCHREFHSGIINLDGLL